MYTSDVIDIRGYAREDVSFSSSAGVTAAAAAEDGVYDVRSTIDCYLKVAEDPSDVTTLTGYPLAANTTMPIRIHKGCKLGVIGGSAATLMVHRAA
jgi:hypothetical protein